MEWITTKEAGAILGVAAGTVWNWIQKGRIPGKTAPSVRGGRDLWIVPADAIADLQADFERQRAATAGLLDSAQVARLLGVRVKTAQNYIAKGRIPAARGWNGQQQYCRREDVEAYRDRIRGWERAPGSCKRCWILLPLDEEGLCSLCRYEVEHGKPFVYLAPEIARGKGKIQL